MRRFIKLLDKEILGLCAKFCAHVCYVAGISLLLPVIFLWLFPPPAEAVGRLSLVEYAVTGVSLVLLSVGVLRRWKRSFAEVMVDLGQTTLVPGLLAVVLAFFSRDILLAWLHPLPAGDKVIPFVAAYIDEAVPTAWAITGIYLALGFGLILWGLWREKYRKRP